MYDVLCTLLPDMGARVAIQRGGTSDSPEQGDLFGPVPAPAHRPDPELVRRRIDRILAQLRAEDSVRGWVHGRASLLRIVFPQLTGWLPEDEAIRFDAEFEAEMVRLGAL